MTATDPRQGLAPGRDHGTLGVRETKQLSKRRPSIVILSTADFNSHVWTNKQHLAVGMAERGFDVHYIESLGLRQPGFSWRDAQRVLGKMALQWRRRGRSRGHQAREGSQNPNVHVITPRILPFHGLRVARAINQRLIRRFVSSRLPPASDSVFWTFSPLTYELEEGCLHVVYHSVDLLHTLPGIPTAALIEAESELMAKAGTVIASSAGVAKHLREVRERSVLLWENVADTDLFSRAAGTRQKRAIFAGNLSTAKVNIGILSDLVKAGVPLALAGPIGIDGSKRSDFSELLAESGVEYLGNLTLPQLAKAIRSSSVGVIPYSINSYTDGVFPMKVYEYLSAGLSVVATELESLVGRDIVGLEVVPDKAFVPAVLSALQTFDESEAAARQESAHEKSWTNRISEAVAIVSQFSKSHES